MYIAIAGTGGLVLLMDLPSYAPPGLKVGQISRTIWVAWVTILEGQVGLIHKPNHLDVTRISHVL